MKNVGWICPRCDKVHAPSVLTCNCKKEESLNVPPDYSDTAKATAKPAFPRTCGTCDKTGGTILTSLPPKIKCPLNNNYYLLDHVCEFETLTATGSTAATEGAGGLVK